MNFEKQGQIKYAAGKVFPSQFDNTMQQNIVVEFPNGEQERVYFPANDPTYTAFQKGQQVKVVWSKTETGRMKKTVFALNPQQPAQQSRPPMANYNPNPRINYQQAKTPNTQNNLEFAIQRLSEFGAMFSLVSQKFPSLSEENRRAIATSILIEGRKEGRDFSTLVKNTPPPPLPNGQSVNQEIVPIEPPPAPAVAGYPKLPDLPVPVKPVVQQQQQQPQQYQQPQQPQQNANLNMLDNIPF